MTDIKQKIASPIPDFEKQRDYSNNKAIGPTSAFKSNTCIPGKKELGFSINLKEMLKIPHETNEESKTLQMKIKKLPIAEQMRGTWLGKSNNTFLLNFPVDELEDEVMG